MSDLFVITTENLGVWANFSSKGWAERSLPEKYFDSAQQKNW